MMALNEKELLEKVNSIFVVRAFTFWFCYFVKSSSKLCSETALLTFQQNDLA